MTPSTHPKYLNKCLPIRRKLAILITLAIVILAFAKYFGTIKSNEQITFITRHLRYTFTLQNKGNQLLQDSEVRIFAPVAHTTSQTVLNINATEPFQTERDELGNQKLVFKLTIPPYGIKTLSIDSEVQLRSKPERIGPIELKDYLTAAPFIETDNALIREKAKIFSVAPAKQRAQKIYDWVRSNINSVEYSQENRGALFALTNRKGDCTEMAFLFTALARVNSIPSRIAAGFVVKDNSLLKPADYHNWAEFYENDAWHIVDAQKQMFDNGYSDYIAFRIFDSGKNSNLSEAQRFMSFDPALVVKMN